jgi:bacterioferritin-associated ferredoxin
LCVDVRDDLSWIKAGPPRVIDKGSQVALSNENDWQLHSYGSPMIVCVCNALSESEIVATAQSAGATSAEEVYAHLGCQPRCRRCLDYASDLIGEAQGSATPPAGSPFRAAEAA